MFKNIIKEFPEVYKKVVFGDWFLYAMVLNCQKKLKAYRLTEVFSAYQEYATGVMGSMSNRAFNQNHINQIKQIRQYLNYKGFSDGFKKAMNSYYLSCFKVEIDDKKYFNAIKIFIYNFVTSQFKTEFRKYGSYVKHNLKL
jgi:hypothetical protein